MKILFVSGNLGKGFLKGITALLLLLLSLPYILFLTVEHLPAVPAATEPAHTIFWERLFRDMYIFFSQGF